MTDQPIPFAPTALAELASYLRDNGPIPTCRASSAQSGTTYPYWGVGRGEVRLSAQGVPTVAPTRRAKSERRAKHLCYNDVLSVCEREGRIHVQQIGRVDEKLARQLIGTLLLQAAAE